MQIDPVQISFMHDIIYFFSMFTGNQLEDQLFNYTYEGSIQLGKMVHQTSPDHLPFAFLALGDADVLLGV